MQALAGGSLPFVCGLAQLSQREAAGQPQRLASLIRPQATAAAHQQRGSRHVLQLLQTLVHCGLADTQAHRGSRFAASRHGRLEYLHMARHQAPRQRAAHPAGGGRAAPVAVSLGQKLQGPGSTQRQLAPGSGRHHAPPGALKQWLPQHAFQLLHRPRHRRLRHMQRTGGSLGTAGMRHGSQGTQQAPVGRQVHGAQAGSTKGNNGSSMTAPSGRRSASPGNGGEVRQLRTAWRASSPR